MSLVPLLSSLSGALAVWVGARSRKLLWYYALWSLICDLLGYVAVPNEYYLWTGNTFILGEFLLVGFYLVSEILLQRYKRTAYSLVVALTIGFVIYVCLQGSWWGLNYKGAAALNALLIPGTLLGFYHILQSAPTRRIERSPLFIFCAAFLLYVAGSFLVLLFEARIVAQDRVLLDHLWALHDILNIMKNLAIAWCLHLYNSAKSNDITS